MHTFRSQLWIFIIADVQKPIIGADFFRHFGLLTDSTTHLRVQGISCSDILHSTSVYQNNINTFYLALLLEFLVVTQISSPTGPAVHDVTHITSKLQDFPFLLALDVCQRNVFE